MNILKGLGKLIFSLDLKVNYLFFFFCCQKDCYSTKLSVVVDEVFFFIYECNSLAFVLPTELQFSG